MGIAMTKSGRGGYNVNCSWENGRVTSYSVTSPIPGIVKVRVNGEVEEIDIKVTKS